MTAILVVDDDELFARSLARDLEAKGYQTEAVGSVDRAWKVLEQRSYDIVLTDLRMTPHSGLELVRAIRRTYPATGPVLMSGCATVRDYQQAVSAGSVAVLVKPFSDAELKEAIQQALTLRTGFRGSVHGLTLIDMLQMFHLGKRSLELEVLGKTRGYVRMIDGEIVDAESDDGNLQGILALRHLLSREHGLINTGLLPENLEHTINTPFDFLLMDAIRANDETGTPHGVHSARPPSISWSDPPTWVGNTALKPAKAAPSPMPSEESEMRSVVREAAQPSAITEAIQVVREWVDVVSRTSPLPDSYAVAAVCCSTGETRIVSGNSALQVGGDAVVSLIEQWKPVVEAQRGFVECVRQNMAIAAGWDEDSDCAVLLVAPMADATESAKFRARTAVLRRVVTKEF